MTSLIKPVLRFKRLAKLNLWMETYNTVNAYVDNKLINVKINIMNESWIRKYVLYKISSIG